MTERKKYKLLITNTDCEKVWWFYGHYKQMVENYHDELKNEFGIRQLPSGKILSHPCVFLYGDTRIHAGKSSAIGVWDE
ncbi:MAG: hypothetical protein QW115_00005 [Thermoplasmata archaeon]